MAFPPLVVSLQAWTGRDFVVIALEIVARQHLYFYFWLDICSKYNTFPH